MVQAEGSDILLARIARESTSIHLEATMNIVRASVAFRLILAACGPSKHLTTMEGSRLTNLT